AAQVDAAIIIGAGLVVDDRTGQQVVAHHVGLVDSLRRAVQEVGVGGRQDDSHVVRQREIRLAVRNGVERAGVCPTGREGGGSALAVQGPNVELYDRTCAGARD